MSNVFCGMHRCETHTHVKGTVDPPAATPLSILVRLIFCFKKNDFDLVVASWRGLSCWRTTFSSGCSILCFSSSFRNSFRDTATPFIKGMPRRGANLTRGFTTVKTYNWALVHVMWLHALGGCIEVLCLFAPRLSS